jgi:hypothetical protein
MGEKNTTHARGGGTKARSETKYGGDDDSRSSCNAWSIHFIFSSNFPTQCAGKESLQCFCATVRAFP